MKARVKEDYPLSIVRAHTGRDYVKYEWRSVPDCDVECPLLDYRKTAVSQDGTTSAGGLESMSAKALKVLAKEKGIKSVARKSKDVLIAELRGE